MKLLLSIILITVISLVGSRVTFLNRNLPLGIRTVLLTGVEYILIGVVLGRFGVNLLDDNTIKNLTPFLIFGLSWIGLLFGLQFEVKFLKKLPRFYFSITAIQAVITFSAVSLAIFGVMFFLTSTAVERIIIIALILGSTASCTAQSAIAIVSRNFKIQNKGLMGLIRYISSVDGLFAVFFCFISLAIAAGFHVSGFSLIDTLVWLFTSIALGVIPAIVMIALSRARFNPSEYLVFLMGTVAFAGGIAIQMARSPLVIGLITGMIVANFCRHRIRAIEIVGQAERSIYIILLLLMGAYWRFDFSMGVVLIIGYVIFRLIGKLSGAFIALRIFPPKYDTPRTMGLGLLSEGGLAVAIILDFQITDPILSQIMMTIIIISIILNELIGPRLILSQIAPGENKRSARMGTNNNQVSK